jgi:FkbM family methyltransferase
MVLDALDRTISERIFVDGVWEENETKFLAAILKPGMVFLDIGANIGYFTLFGSELVGTVGKVIAFEPEPSRFSLLTANVRQSPRENVHPVNKAVSNITGAAMLFLASAKNPGDHRLFDTPDHRSCVEIQTIRLDDYFVEGQEVVDVIKMDIQGSEMLALQGMVRVLDSNKRVTILTEFWKQGIRNSGYDPKLVLDFLRDHGFSLNLFEKNTGIVRGASPREIISHRDLELSLVCQKK